MPHVNTPIQVFTAAGTGRLVPREVGTSTGAQRSRNPRPRLTPSRLQFLPDRRPANHRDRRPRVGPHGYASPSAAATSARESAPSRSSCHVPWLP